MNEVERMSALLSLLKKTYPTAHIALRFSSPWELLVAVILSAQCTDVMVNKVTETLFLKYPTFQSYMQADLAEFEQDIRSTGFYHNKAKHILATARRIHDVFGGRVPQTMEDLTSLAGVARKTANIVLSQAFQVTVGIAVDTHVQRVSQRLRLVPLETIGGKKVVAFEKNGKEVVDYKKDADPQKLEQALMRTIPKAVWGSVTYQLIDHGRAWCRAIRPDCPGCPLRMLCPASRV